MSTGRDTWDNWWHPQNETLTTLLFGYLFFSRQGFVLQPSLALSFQSFYLSLQVSESSTSQSALQQLKQQQQQQPSSPCHVVSYVVIRNIKTDYKGMKTRRATEHPPTHMDTPLSAPICINHLWSHTWRCQWLTGGRGTEELQRREEQMHYSISMLFLCDSY